MDPQRSRRRPQRTCVLCRRKGDKDGLLRISGRPEKGWVPDPQGTRPGRGIYLCRDAGCIGEFTKVIRTRKGAARWKLGGSAEALATSLEVILAGSGRPDTGAGKQEGTGCARRGRGAS